MTVEHLIAQVKPLAAEYHRLTGKPLGATGEIGENEVARLLDLKLVEARTPGYDATNRSGERRYQIKARSLDEESRKKSQNTGRMNLNKEWDAVLLAIMDEKFQMLEIWEAVERLQVELEKPGSKGRNERHPACRSSRKSADDAILKGSERERGIGFASFRISPPWRADSGPLSDPVELRQHRGERCRWDATDSGLQAAEELGPLGGRYRRFVTVRVCAGRELPHFRSLPGRPVEVARVAHSDDAP